MYVEAEKYPAVFVEYEDVCWLTVRYRYGQGPGGAFAGVITGGCSGSNLPRTQIGASSMPAMGAVRVGSEYVPR